MLSCRLTSFEFLLHNYGSIVFQIRIAYLVDSGSPKWQLRLKLDDTIWNTGNVCWWQRYHNCFLKTDWVGPPRFCCNTYEEVIFQTRVRVFYQGFQTRENRWKPETVGRGLLLFSSVWKSPVKQEARVFEMASQSAPNYKQKKKENKRTEERKNHNHVIFALFCLISAQFVMT